MAKTFTASAAGDEQEPLPFTLNGVYRKGYEPEGSDGSWSEDFEAYGTPPASIAGAMRSAIILDERQRQQVNPGMVVDFIERALVPESAPRFRALIDSDERLVKLELLGEVFNWLAKELLGGRPTPPSGS